MGKQNYKIMLIYKYNIFKNIIFVLQYNYNVVGCHGDKEKLQNNAFLLGRYPK